MIPLSDENPAHRTPIVTTLLIALCLGVLVWTLTLDGYDLTWAYQTLGTAPAVLLGKATIQPYFAGFPPAASLITALFVHAGVLHLAGNVLFLWVFGNNVEDRLGHLRFLIFYLAAGVAATLVHVALFPGSDVPVVGASGAVSGVLGAYLLLFPHARVRVLFPPFFFRTFRLPAWLFLGLWFVLQGFVGAEDVYVAAAPGAEQGGVAWAAHVGGFVAGMVLVAAMRPKGVPLLARVGRGGAAMVARKSGTVPEVGRGRPTAPRGVVPKPRTPTIRR